MFLRPLAGLALALALAAGALARPEPPLVHYTLRTAEKDPHLHVSATFPTFGRHRLEIELPVWRPGSYRFQRYDERLDGFAAWPGASAPDPATDPPSLDVLRLRRNAWEVRCADLSHVTVTYRVERRVSARDEGGQVEGPGTWVYSSADKQLPCRVRFDLPEAWGTESGLAPTDDPRVFEAVDYDTFADCPVTYGIFEVHRFTSGGVEHRVVLQGHRPDDLDRGAFVDGVRQICDYQIALFQHVPYDFYVFLYTLSPSMGGGGGLEHLNSTSISIGGPALARNPRAADSVTAHEFFHLWNVKRIRPAVLGPFDYNRDNRTRALWFAEGVTSYYATLTLTRTGLREPGHLWSSAQRLIQAQESSTGATTVSAEDASWNIWDPREPEEGRISYYTKGELLGLLLDLRIRHETHNQRTLDDVLRFLNRWHAREGVGFAEGDLRRAVDAVTGIDSADFFDRHVEGTVDLPYREYLAYAGMDLDLEIEEYGSPPFRARGDDLAIDALDPRTDAFRAGLRSGDRVLRVDDAPVASSQDLNEAFRASPLDHPRAVVVQRGERERTIEMSPRVRRRVRARIAELPEPTALQRTIRVGLERGVPGAPTAR